MCMYSLQAYARGHLVRGELGRARADFEEVVKEIDGTLNHLEWKNAIIQTPHFKDTDGPLPRKDPEPDVSITSQNPVAGDIGPSSENGEWSQCFQTIEPQKDASGVPPQKNACLQSSQVLEDSQNLPIPVEVLESVMDSTSIWSSMNSLPQKDWPLYGSAQDVPPTPEALRCHRDALTMELLWLQQAIDSRKKYLSLKDKLTIS
ncbi:IQ domain-containing protein C [Stigmatopora nigra]